ncbi:unnamed protein product, partial [Closterium sp. NIES-54]
QSLDHPGAFSPLPSALHFPLTLLSPSAPLASPLLPPSRLLPSPLHFPLTVLPTPFPFPCAPLRSPLPSPPFLFLGNPRSISRGTAPAYTIRFGAAVAGADSPPSNLLLSLPRGAPPLVLCRGSAECQWVATTPSVWEVAGERRMRGVDVRQARVLEEMLTAVGEGGGSGEDSAVVGEGSDAVAGYGVRAAAAVEGGDEGQYDLVGALQRSREYSHDIIIPRYPPEDPRLEVRLEGGMGGMGGMGDMGEMGERGEMTEGLSGGVCGGAFMLGAFKDGHVVVNSDIRIIGPAQRPSAIHLLVDYPEPSSLQASSLQVVSLQCDSWAELKPQMWRAQCSSRWSSGSGSSSSRWSSSSADAASSQGRTQNMSEGVFNRFACFAVDGESSPSVAVLSVAVGGTSGQSGVGGIEAVGGIVWRAPDLEQGEEQGKQRGSGGATTVAAASLTVPAESAEAADSAQAVDSAEAGKGVDSVAGAESATSTKCESSELPFADDAERTTTYQRIEYVEADIDGTDILVHGRTFSNADEGEFSVVIEGAYNEDEGETADNTDKAGDVVGPGLGDGRTAGAEAGAAFMPSPSVSHRLSHTSHLPRLPRLPHQHHGSVSSASHGACDRSSFAVKERDAGPAVESC